MLILYYLKIGIYCNGTLYLEVAMFGARWPTGNGTLTRKSLESLQSFVQIVLFLIVDPKLKLHIFQISHEFPMRYLLHLGVFFLSPIWLLLKLFLYQKKSFINHSNIVQDQRICFSPINESFHCNNCIAVSQSQYASSWNRTTATIRKWINAVTNVSSHESIPSEFGLINHNAQ